MTIGLSPSSLLQQWSVTATGLILCSLWHADRSPTYNAHANADGTREGILSSRALTIGAQASVTTSDSRSVSSER